MKVSHNRYQTIEAI